MKRLALPVFMAVFFMLAGALIDRALVSRAIDHMAGDLLDALEREAACEWRMRAVIER